MLGLQGERNCEGAQTDLDGVPESKEGKEFQKLCHRARRTLQRERKIRLHEGEELFSKTERQVS